MGADDYILDNYNLFMNPSLMFTRGGAENQFSYDYLNSIHGNPEPSYNPYSVRNFPSGPLFGDSASFGGFYNPGYSYLGNGNQVSAFENYTSAQSSDFIFNASGGVNYKRSGYYNSGQTMLNTSGMYGNSLPENMVTGGIYTVEDVEDSSKGYRYGITVGGGVRYYDPKGKELTADEFKTAVGSDYDKFKTSINKEYEKRGIDKTIS